MSQATFAPNPNLYYRHSGRYPIASIFLSLIAGSVVACILGGIYAYIDLYNPIAGWVTFIVTGGTGLVMGLVMTKLLKFGKVRNTKIAVLATFLVAMVMYLFCWEVWIFALLRRNEEFVPFMTLLSDPSGVWELIKIVNTHGAWSIKGSTPSGIFLDIIWLLEAGFLIGIPVAWVKSAMNEVPFCEQCNKWGAKQTVTQLNAPTEADKAVVLSRVESRDFSIFEKLGLAQPSTTSFWDVTFQGCASCDSTQTLNIEAITITTDNKGNPTRNATPVIARLLLSPEDTVLIATTVAAMSQPTASPASEAAASTDAAAPAIPLEPETAGVTTDAPAQT